MALLAGSASAQDVYKCVQDGQTSYSATPCTAGQLQILEIPSPPPAVDKGAATRQERVASQLEAVCAGHSDYTHVLNGRFKGGHITRHYGNPAEDIHAVQLELSQATYMEEFEPFRYRADLAAPTQVVLKALLQTFLSWGQQRYA